MMMDVVRLSASPAGLRSKALKSALTPREAAALDQPDDRGEEADDERLERDRARSWRRDADRPQVANSRTRCATVIDSVLKMTNAPTKSAIAAKESRK